jgi:putative Ca2+/H+ antiporter (TMEM165/GDT1 family)
MWKSFAAIFSTVFLAEIGDKTQLATMLFSAEGQVSRWVVFAASAAALVTASAIGVVLGAQVERLVKPQTLKLIAGVGFIAIGVWTIASR